jgi:hypothetical protein
MLADIFNYGKECLMWVGLENTTMTEACEVESPAEQNYVTIIEKTEINWFSET